MTLPTEDAIGIKLVGGPAHMDGWTNAYSAQELGGWPPPEFLAALSIGGRVAIALPQNVPEDFKKDVTMYRKIKQSGLIDPKHPNIMRGATYEVVK
jgi:hypothetical protein